MTSTPTHTYTLAVSFTGLESLVSTTNAGGKCFVKNRNTREVKYYDAKTTTTTTASLVIDTKDWTTAWVTGHVIEVGMMGQEHGTKVHTVDTTKGGGKLTIAVTATSSTTHPSMIL